MRVKVVLDTKTQLDTFVSICEKIPDTVYLSDGSKEFRVSAKSTLGCILAKTEWENVYCECEGKDASTLESRLRNAGLTAE